MITWEKVVELEPRLGELKKEAEAVDGSGEHFCANATWYSTFKPRLLRLAGWESTSQHPEMRTQEAYDIAYGGVYDVLPSCNGCMCM